MQAVLVSVMAGACGGGPTAPSSLSAGRWTGTTTQGAAISFEVSSAEALTTVTVGYSFNGCSGTQTFSNLNISTIPNVICIPGPCTTSPPTRSFTFSNGAPGSGPVTMVNGVFMPGGSAWGIVGFLDYPGCGTADRVSWNATRRR